MKRYDIPRAKAIELRERGHTLNDIADRLCVPKSTVYGWIRAVEIKKPNAFIGMSRRKNREAARNAAFALRRKYAAVHSEHREQAAALWKEGLSHDEQFKLFLMLYLTEGKRRCRGTVGFCNTNPALIRFGSSILVKLNGGKHKVTYSLLLRENMDRCGIVSFWKDYLGIDDVKVYVRGGGGKLKGRNRCAQNGIMTVLVCDSFLKTRIETWISLFVSEQLDPAVEQ